mmetsp:Transcript_37486/g.81994  ORF Transcript_37486/g.81994 Transcript_37486/m.81994 type:complete len:537 (+) Transcript_37486:54-1664(+)
MSPAAVQRTVSGAAVVQRPGKAAKFRRASSRENGNTDWASRARLEKILTETQQQLQVAQQRFDRFRDYCLKLESELGAYQKKEEELEETIRGLHAAGREKCCSACGAAALQSANSNDPAGSASSPNGPSEAVFGAILEVAPVSTLHAHVQNQPGGRCSATETSPDAPNIGECLPAHSGADADDAGREVQHTQVCAAVQCDLLVSLEAARAGELQAARVVQLEQQIAMLVSRLGKQPGPQSSEPADRVPLPDVVQRTEAEDRVGVGSVPGSSAQPQMVSVCLRRESEFGVVPTAVGSHHVPSAPAACPTARVEAAQLWASSPRLAAQPAADPAISRLGAGVSESFQQRSGIDTRAAAPDHQPESDGSSSLTCRDKASPAAAKKQHEDLISQASRTKQMLGMKVSAMSGQISSLEAKLAALQAHSNVRAMPGYVTARSAPASGPLGSAGASGSLRPSAGGSAGALHSWSRDTSGALTAVHPLRFHSRERGFSTPGNAGPGTPRVDTPLVQSVAFSPAAPMTQAPRQFSARTVCRLYQA